MQTSMTTKVTPLSLTFVYGHPEHDKRVEVWSELKQLRNIAHKS